MSKDLSNIPFGSSEYRRGPRIAKYSDEFLPVARKPGLIPTCCVPTCDCGGATAWLDSVPYAG
eukprot:3237814-Pyramimonas_sp.AAC.1